VKKSQPQRFGSSTADIGNAKYRNRPPSAALGRVIEAVDLAEMPIQDPLHEKSLAEIGPNRLLAYLSRAGAVRKSLLRTYAAESLKFIGCVTDSPHRSGNQSCVTSSPHFRKWSSKPSGCES